MKNKHILHDILEWYQSCGIDAALQDNSRNYFQPYFENETLPTQDIFPTPMAKPKLKPTTHPAFDCDSLESLRQAVESYEACDLKKSATHTVFCDGNPHASIMLVGEAPGADEDRLGKPFVGQSGQLLDRMLNAIHLDRTKVYISNIIPWRPPGNRPPTTSEIALCQPFIERHIDLINPKVLVLLGGVATKTLLNKTEGILKLRGALQTYTTQMGKNIPTLCMFHPAYLLRSPGQKATAWKDFLFLESYIKENKI